MSQNTYSYKVADSLYLVRHQIGSDKKEPAKPVEVPTDHIMIYDCSGSMSYDLPKIREQVKKKLPKMLKENDTFSAIWFSGRGECGILLEKEPVATLKDLQEVEKAVDRWLKPVGLTGFKEPLEKALSLADKLGTNGRAVSLTFMSDGCDNQWPRADILKVVEKLGPKVSCSTFVEYGYYADRPLLTAMAEKAGGTLIFAEDFDGYQPAFEAAMTKKASGAKRVEVTIKGDPIGGFAYAMVDGDLVTFAASSGKIAVPEDLREVFYMSPTSIGTTDTFGFTKDTPPTTLQDISKYVSSGEQYQRAAVEQVLGAGYAAVSLFAIRMKSDVVYPLLKSVGDVRLIEQFATCFGKQKYSAFMDEAKTAAFGTKRFEKGWDPNKVPRDDAFTVLQVLDLLQQDDKARVLLDHPEFKYSKIGRGRVDASAQLSETEIEELRKLTDALSKEKDVGKIKELNQKIAAFTEGKGETLKFVQDAAPDGYPILKLTFNEDRPNISFLVKKTGKVDLSKRVTSEFKGKIPETFETFVYRNYAVIKDGLVNIDKLPVRISTATFQKLLSEGIVAGGDNIGSNPDTADVILDLKKLPVINRQMIKGVSAKDFFTTQWELNKAQAAQKVLNGYAKELLPEKKSASFAEKYGETGATWLKEQGITDYNGYQPPSTKQAESTDFYMGKELKVSLKGLSKLPSMKEAKEQIAKKKLNAGGALMAETIKKVEAFLASDIYTKAAAKEKVLQSWLEGEQTATKARVRSLIFDTAKTTFTLVVGQVWFSEFNSLDENELTLDVDGQKIACKAEMKDIEIKI
jgi:hypothetical protein